MAHQTGVLEHEHHGNGGNQDNLTPLAIDPGDVEGENKLSFCDSQFQKASNSATSSSNPSTGASSGYAHFNRAMIMLLIAFTVIPGRVLASEDRVSYEADGDDPSAILGSLRGNVETTPDSSTTGAAGTPDCDSCSDNPTPWMRRNDKTCATSPSLIETKCRENVKWANGNWCQQSCFDAERGYDGDNCCDPIPSKALTRFANAIVDEAQLCPDCEAEKVLQSALETYGDGDQVTDKTVSQLMAALNDNPTDTFDNAKVALIEQNGKHDTCDAGPELAASGNSGLCKRDSKKAKIQTIESKILERIDEAEMMRMEPDMDAIVSNVSKELGLDELTIAWLIEEDQPTAEEIKGHYESAESNIMNAVLHEQAMEVGKKLNDIIDTGKDLDEAVSESGFAGATIEEAFRYFDEIQGTSVQGSGIKEELDNKGGNGKREELNARVEKAYADRGWTKKQNGEGEANAYTTWEPPGGGDGSKWAKGQNKGVGTASEKGKEGSRGEFYTDKDGYLHFHPPVSSTSFEEMKKEIEEENGRGHSRRLMNRYIQDSHDIDRRLNEHVGELHRHLLDLSNLCGDELNSMGCFQDNINDRDLPYRHGNVNSVQSCLSACNERGCDFAGLQGGGMCYCGESYGSYGTSTSCNMGCQTGPGKCGGSSSISVYKYVAYRNIGCVGTSFENLASDLLDVKGRVSSSIHPLTVILDRVADGVELINTAKTTGQLVQVALTIGGNIPYIGPAIKVASRFVDPVVNVIKRVADKAQAFQNNVGRLWQRSIGQLSEVLDKMETGFILPISAMGIAFSSVSSDQCTVSIVNELANMDVVGLTDQALGSAFDYVETLLNALTAISSALASSTWKAIQDALQSVVDNLQPVLDFFAPLKPLGELLKREVVLPWFQPPYTEKHLGSAYCNSGYHKGVWPDTCWENESWHWAGHTCLPPYCMRRTCHSGGYSDRRILGIWAGCYNHHYRAHTRGLSCSCSCSCSWRGCNCRCGCSCPGGYGTYWWRPWECTQHCPGDRSMHLGWCYKKSCNGGFSKNGVQVCNPETRRRNSHTAKCDRYSSTGRKQLKLGECWQECASGHSGFAGLCFPPAQLRISVEGIADALQDIIDFIKDLPIVREIQNAIDSIVGAILRPVTDYILRMAGFNMPEFPDLSVDSLPLDFFDDYSFNLPSLPNISPMFDLPETIMKALPGVPDVLANCGVDVGCLTEAMGMNNIIDNALDDIEDIIDVLDMPSIKADVFELFSDITCVEWTEVTLPVEEFVRAIPGIDGVENECDYTVPVCSSFDVSGAQAIIDNVFKPLLDGGSSFDPDFILKKQLFSKLGSAFAPLSVEVPHSLALSLGRDSYRGDYPCTQHPGSLKILSTKVEGRGDTEYPDALYLKLMPSIALTLAPEIDFCNGKFSIAFMPNFSVSIVLNKGNERLFRGAVDTAHNYKERGEYEMKAVDMTDCVASHCPSGQSCNPDWIFNRRNDLHVRLCTLKYGAISVARHGWFIKKSILASEILAALNTREEEIFGTKRLEAKVTENNPLPHCQSGQMENALKNKPADYWESKDGHDYSWPCIKYWFDQKTILDDFKAKIDALTSAMVPRSAGQVNPALWEKTVRHSTFSSSSLQTPINAAYQALTGSPLIPTNSANAVTTSVAVTGTHPFYTSTSIGASFEFDGIFEGFKDFDVGAFDRSHLFGQLMEGDKSAKANGLKNNVTKTWEWGATFKVEYKWNQELFDFHAWDVC